MSNKWLGKGGISSAAILHADHCVIESLLN